MREVYYIFLVVLVYRSIAGYLLPCPVLVIYSYFAGEPYTIYILCAQYITRAVLSTTAGRKQGHRYNNRTVIRAKAKKTYGKHSMVKEPIQNNICIRGIYYSSK